LEGKRGKTLVFHSIIIKYIVNTEYTHRYIVFYSIIHVAKHFC
jgi:hypothetical protein